MKKILTKLLSKLYDKARSSSTFKSLYYSVANSNYFTSFQEHEKMLGDKLRVNTYYKAIQKNVNEGDVVIDLGTGTGILSFMASKKNPKKIFAIEHGKIIESAKTAAAHNGIKNIEFVNVNSKNFKADEKADIIIHEQIGALLFDENMVENLIDLRDRVLKPGGKILPGKFEFFVEPVHIKDEENVPYLWEQNIEGIKFDCFSDLKKEIKGSYGRLLIRPDAVDYFLSEPERILYFDIETMSGNDIPKKFEFNRKVLKSGKLNGLIIFFNIIFDEEIMLTTSPFTSKTHWNIPLLRTETIYCNKGDVLKIYFEMGDPSDISTYKWSFKKQSI
ncbi:MAG: methyltransferase domain-containing protein [Ignavibacteria bacterium]